ncbi:MAG: S-layer homology domain-containing protein [Thermotaleaceae bacterium]
MKFYKRRIFVLCLVLLLMTSTVAASNSSLQEIGVKLKALGLLIGDPNGDMRFGDNITRAEFTAVAVRTLGKETEALTRRGTTRFKDVDKTHWSTGHINISVDNNVIVGYPDSTFRPQRNITHGEVLTILVNTLGYKNEVKGNNWPDNYIAKANQLGITKGMTIRASSPAARGDVARMLDNSLTIPLKK